MSKHDRWKLIYAYIISPLYIMLSVSGNITSELYKKYGNRAIGGVPFSTVLIFTMIGYFPYVIPSTVMRFAVLRRKLSYGLELYLNMLLSMAICLTMYLLLLGTTGYSLGLLGTLTIYCILSYGSTERNDIPNGLRYTLTAVTLVAPFVLIYLESLLKTRQAYFPLWEAFFLSVMVNCHREESPQTEADAPAQEDDGVTDDTYDDFRRMKADTAKELVDAGLASIGRKTKHQNPRLTPDSEQKRHRVERPLLKALADRYRDEGQRKKLARHFMLYKEMSLFIIYGALLKQDAELHSMVKAKLKTRLTGVMPTQVIHMRDEYWRELTRKFYGEFRSSGDMGEALKSAFCRTLSEKYPVWANEGELCGLVAGEHLMRIFMYSYGAVEACF